MTCQECKERMYPENPGQPFYVSLKHKGDRNAGHYLPPLCNSCSGRYGRKKESPQIERKVIFHSIPLPSAPRVKPQFIDIRV